MMRWFEAAGADWVANPELTRMISVRRHNLAAAGLQHRLRPQVHTCAHLGPRRHAASDVGLNASATCIASCQPMIDQPPVRTTRKAWSVPPAFTVVPAALVPSALLAVTASVPPFTVVAPV